MNDFVLVGKFQKVLVYLANLTRPKKVIFEIKPVSNMFIARKLMTLDPLSIIANLWLRHRYQFLFYKKNFVYAPELFYCDRVEPENVRDEKVCLYGSSIVNKSTIEATSEIVNLHLGYLPQYKGCKPEVWALSQGEYPGVSLHKVIPKIDAGEILTRYKLKNLDSSFCHIRKRLLDMGAEMVNWWMAGKLSPIDISKENGHYYSTPDFKTIQQAYKNLNEMIKDNQ